MPAKYSAARLTVLWGALVLPIGPVLAQNSPMDTRDSSQMLTGRADSISDRRSFVSGNFPEELPPLLAPNEVTEWLLKAGIRSYGWIDGGFTYSSTGYGLLGPAPTPNRFGQQFLLNGAWLITELKPEPKRWSIGFRADFYAGSDAALLRPLNSFGPGGTHFGTDFRQAYVSLHTPGVGVRGIDWTIGRQNVPTGFETLMGPYRPMYSETYFWIKYEVGSTSAIATVHPTSKLDILGGVVLGYNTVFELRGRAPSYIARAMYRPTGRKTTQILVTAYTGPEPFATTAGHVGTWQTLGELQLRHTWSERIYQVAQVHYSADIGDPAIGGRNASTQGAFVLTAYRWTKDLYAGLRTEWFDDPHGIRTGKPGSFGAATLGLNFMPIRSLNFRPEVRGDFASQPSFTSAEQTTPRRNQLSVAFDLIWKFNSY